MNPVKPVIQHHPMHRVYQLLRNNKRSGPFTLEELQTNSLQPHDLIWVDGKSAGWQYPSEINELKKLVEASKEELSPVKEKCYSKDTSSSTANISTGSKRSGIFVSLPGMVRKVDQPVSPPVQEDRREAFEKKAEALFNSVQLFAQQENKTVDEEITESEVKYTKSLQELKYEYASWIHQQKNKNSNWKNKKWMVAACFLVIGIVAFVFAYRSDKVDSLAFQSGPSYPNDELVTPAIEDENRINIINTTEKAKPVKSPVRKTRTNSFEKQKRSEKKPDVVPTAKKEEIHQEKNKIPLPQLVKINGSYKPIGNGVAKPRVTVRNNSMETLSVVAVNIVYYKADGSPAGKEILYFNQLSPNESMTLKAPANPVAEEVKFKLGLISSKEGGIYYALQ